MRKDLVLKALVILMLIWGVAWGISSLTASREANAQRFIRTYEASALVTGSADRDTEERREALTELAEVMNLMDFKEREKLRADRRDAQFFDALSPQEQELWIKLTIEKSLTKVMEAIDAMPSAQRKEFIEKGLAELEKGPAKDDMDRLAELDPQLIDEITQKGMTAYYQEAGADTKMDLAPLMEAMNGVMQGIRGNQFDPNSR